MAQARLMRWAHWIDGETAVSHRIPFPLLTAQTELSTGRGRCVLIRRLPGIKGRATPTLRKTLCVSSHSISRDTAGTMKQPLVGIAATLLVMAVSLALISLFSFETFS